MEIDYTLLRYLTLGENTSAYSAKTINIFHAAKKEILMEMILTTDGKIPKYHRDSKTEKKWLNSPNNPLHPDNEEIIQEKLKLQLEYLDCERPI
ncbi:hypothetical protein LCGC14_1483530 [marine sediment metagenome]|uniref:Uncharacterized protein n=1 Tax=marine sediment metagenome TaxID=412755 RepID=A0A0F9MAM2_9ZZZZ